MENLGDFKDRCIPQVKATQFLNTFYYLYAVKTSIAGTTQKPYNLIVYFG